MRGKAPLRRDPKRLGAICWFFLFLWTYLHPSFFPLNVSTDPRLISSFFFLYFSFLLPTVLLPISVLVPISSSVLNPLNPNYLNPYIHSSSTILSFRIYRFLFFLALKSSLFHIPVRLFKELICYNLRTFLSWLTYLLFIEKYIN